VPSQRMIELSPSFAVWGGRLLLARGGNQGAFSRHQGQGACKDQNTKINRVLCLSFFCFIFSGIILSTSTVSTFTNSSNMETLIRQQLPATTLKMRLLSLSLLLSAHRLILMTMTIPKYRPASAGKFYRCNTEMIYRNTDRPVPVIYRYRPGGGTSFLGFFGALKN